MYYVCTAHYTENFANTKINHLVQAGLEFFCQSASVDCPWVLKPTNLGTVSQTQDICLQTHWVYFSGQAPTATPHWKCQIALI